MLLAIVNGAIVVLGIGLLIFIHELGHFLVAKKVGIRVEAFSLGFGPRIWGFLRGGTEYKVCIVPLGGYVKMAGETGVGETTGHPDEFASKTIAQRAWVVSAGVIMNIIFAFIVFPIAFGLGVPFAPNVIGNVHAGSPAWEAGLRSGDEVLEVDGARIYGFADINIEVALSGETVDFLVRRQTGDETISVRPQFVESRGINQVGISPTYEVRFPDDTEYLSALEGVNSMNRVLAIDGIPIERIVAANGAGYNDLEKATSPHLVTFLDDDGNSIDRVITAEWEPGEGHEVGVMRWLNRVTAVRSSSPAERAGLAQDDLIVSVNGQWVQLRSQIERALIGAQDDASITLRVRRGDREFDLEAFSLTDDYAALAFLDSFLLGADENGRRLFPFPGRAAARAGLLASDEVVSVDSKPIGHEDDLLEALREAIDGAEPFTVTVARGDAEATLTITPEPTRRSTLFSALSARTELRPVPIAFPESVSAGFRQVGREIKRFMLMIKKLFAGDVDKRHVGGIIRIAHASYKFTEQGFAKILFFLAMLSVNLAIINILPIPILDGGHLVYLILEKIKGGPISEHAMAISSWIGLGLVLALMVFATFNDIRWLIG